MIVKNIGTGERIVRLIFGLIFIALAFLPQWHGGWSVLWLVLGVTGVAQSVVCM